MNFFDAADKVLASYMAVFFVAFAISVIATPLMRKLAVHKGIVDWPDLHHKNHSDPVAYLGGVALFLAWAGGLSACYFLTPHDTSTAIQPTAILSILFGAVCITATGLIDDVYSISPRVKIGGQFLAAGGLALSGQSLGTLLVGRTFDLAGLNINFTVAYVLGAALIAMFVVGGCNSVNLLDGLDGLAAGVTAIACTGFLLITIVTAAERMTETDPLRVVMCLALLGALLGFLPFNFSPANIFMGDAGSLLIGYVCVTIILLFSNQKFGPLMVIAALVVFALPLTDTVLAIFRRKLQGKPVFSPDNQHLHHQIVRVMQRAGCGPGMSIKMAVLTMYILALMFAVLGCSLVYLRARYALAVFLPLFGFIVIGAYKVGHQHRTLVGAPPQSQDSSDLAVASSE